MSWHRYKDHNDQSKPRRQLIKDGRDGKENQGNQDQDNQEDQDSLIEKTLLNSGTHSSEQDHTDTHPHTPAADLCHGLQLKLHFHQLNKKNEQDAKILLNSGTQASEQNHTSQEIQV